MRHFIDFCVRNLSKIPLLIYIIIFVLCSFICSIVFFDKLPSFVVVSLSWVSLFAIPFYVIILLFRKANKRDQIDIEHQQKLFDMFEKVENEYKDILKQNGSFYEKNIWREDLSRFLALDVNSGSLVIGSLNLSLNCKRKHCVLYPTYCLGINSKKRKPFCSIPSYKWSIVKISPIDILDCQLIIEDNGKSYARAISLAFCLNNITAPYVEFNFIDKPLKKTSKGYCNRVNNAKQWYGKLRVVMQKFKDKN